MGSDCWANRADKKTFGLKILVFYLVTIGGPDGGGCGNVCGGEGWEDEKGETEMELSEK